MSVPVFVDGTVVGMPVPPEFPPNKEEKSILPAVPVMKGDPLFPVPVPIVPKGDPLFPVPVPVVPKSDPLFPVPVPVMPNGDPLFPVPVPVVATGDPLFPVASEPKVGVDPPPILSNDPNGEPALNPSDGTPPAGDWIELLKPLSNVPKPLPKGCTE